MLSCGASRRRLTARRRSPCKICENFAQYLKLIENLLAKLRLSDLKQHPETREPLERLEESLRKAFDLVNSCRNKSFLYLLAMGWKIAHQFKIREMEIDRLLQLIPLISLVDNNRAKMELHEIQRDEKDVRLQEAILSLAESRELQKNLSGLEALRTENKKLRKELEKMQDEDQCKECKVIRRLIDIRREIN